MVGLQPPPKVDTKRGATLWVLLAIGLAVLDRFVTPGQITTGDWFLSAASTAAWLVAALNAKSAISRVVLWIIVVIQSIFWIVALGLLGSTSLITNLSVGDCFDDPGTDVITTVEEIACSEPHDNEVYLVSSMPGRDDDDYPTLQEFGEFARLECGGSFESYVGVSYFESSLDWSFVRPAEDSWNDGGRTITCFVYDFTGQKLGQSVAGSGI